MRRSLLFFAFLLSAIAANAAELRVTAAAPEGELADIAQANEIRVVFSEPMVVIGRIPEPVRPPFFRIDPPIGGNFRWSGTSTLIFRPAPEELRYATEYRVTVDASAESIHGSRLAAPLRFSFTTPTLRLVHAQWYAKPDGAVVFGLQFNQPVEAERILPHVRLALQPHEPDFQGIQPPGPISLAADSNARAAFDEKKRKVAEAARSSRKVMAFLPESWDTRRIAADPNVLVVETEPRIPPGAWVRVAIDPDAPSAGGSEVPGFEQEHVAMLGPGFFVRRATCVRRCNPDWRHPIEFTEPVDPKTLAGAIEVWDVTDPSAPRKVEPSSARQDDEGEWYETPLVALEDLGYRVEPARTYRVVIPPDFRSASGEPLGYTWAGHLEYWHRLAFSSFGEGHGVWEPEGGPLVPFWARNLRSVREWVRPLSKDELMPAIVRNEERGFRISPDNRPLVRQLRPVPDELQSYGVDASGVLGAGHRGLFWAAVEEGEPIAKAERTGEQDGKVQPTSTIVQATDLGLTVKHSPLGVLVWVTRLSDASRVEGARVEIRNRENEVVWTGSTDTEGVALAPRVQIRKQWWQTEFVAIAEKDGDLAYAASNWHQGILPWFFGLSFDAEPTLQRLRGTAFTDRGVYRPGESVHVKLIFRSDTATGIELYPEGTEVTIMILNPRSDLVALETARLSRWSSAEIEWDVPESAVFGGYSIQASPAAQMEETVHGGFLVAAYRRPDFRVDVELGSDDPIAGTTITGTTESRYLFGAPMAGMPVRWRYLRLPVFSAPEALQELFPARDFVWIDECGFGDGAREVVIREQETKLTSEGTLPLALETTREAAAPHLYQLEAEVTDVSRQAIAGRASLLVHPAPWYVGLRRVDTFVRGAEPFRTEIVAATPAGSIVPGVSVSLTLTQVQWHSVRRAEGNGFYTWETERREVPAGSWTVTTEGQPVPFEVPVPRGGFYQLVASATEDGRTARSCLSFYAAGEGYTAWERFDHNRIELVPERTRYAPGETARLLVKSPWESATALVTTERETVRTHRTFQLDSTQQTIEIPITEQDVPNLFVSVVLVKGRTPAAIDEGGSDPGKPSFRLGYAEIKVDDDTKRLQVELRPAAEELRPGSKTSIAVSVRGPDREPVEAEVTLWAVDYGVLSLTGYTTPQVLESIWVDEPLQVITADSRQKIIARRALTPKGTSAGGGGGAELGADATRTDFRPLAFWIGSVETGADGAATVEVTLPDSLTTYRIMAVASDRQSRFGSAQDELRTSKPVLLRATFPRFLTVGDEASFGAVIHNQLSRGGRATVTIRSLDPSVLEIRGGDRKRVQIDASAAEEVRFAAVAKAPGLAQVEMTVRLGNESDAFRDAIPVLVPVSPEVVAAYGSVPPDGEERLAIPPNVFPHIGGLRVEMASTALVGLSEGARYLVTYPYGCAEQRASALFAMLTARELGEIFSVPELRVDHDLVVSAIEELEQFQCESGGFAFWKGACASESPYVTAWLVHVLRLADELGYEPRPEPLERAYQYLERALAESKPEGESQVVWSSWQTFAVRELALAGRNVDAELNRLWEAIDRAPVFALAWLHDALLARGEASAARAAELRRRIDNSILREGGASHVEELEGPLLEFVWSSNVRSTAIVLQSLTAAGADEALTRSLVRWLMDARRDGRWGSTQENAWAMEALVAYTRKYEAEEPDFLATATLGSDTVAQESMRGRSTDAAVTEITMKALQATTDGELPLRFSKEGSGTLHYGARLTYARRSADLLPLDQGFTIERSWAREGAATSEDATRFEPGELVRVTLRIRIPKERIWVAVSDPLPAGFEPVDAWFRTTASDLAQVATVQERRDRTGREVRPAWLTWFDSSGFDHVEKKDDRVDLFATRLPEGEHVFSYLVRATTSGTFRVAPTRAEQMYSPEVFGRGASAVVVVE